MGRRLTLPRLQLTYRRSGETVWCLRAPGGKLTRLPSAPAPEPAAHPA